MTSSPHFSFLYTFGFYYYQSRSVPRRLLTLACQYFQTVVKENVWLKIAGNLRTPLLFLSQGITSQMFLIQKLARGRGHQQQILTPAVVLFQVESHLGLGRGISSNPQPCKENLLPHYSLQLILKFQQKIIFGGEQHINYWRLGNLFQCLGKA